jgi:murein DD-endopeptidase MepM/ murein hydrolase activator NlpD
VYALPYQGGESYRVSQAYDGSFSHTGAERYAIDWKMPEGTPVLAARGGVVVALKDDSSAHGESRRFETAANYVLIRHSDGTIGNYAHLLKGGVKVKVGQVVRSGDMIALSVNTGFSSGPHLHFCVFKTRSGRERESIPVLFKTVNGDMTLVTGRTYQAPKTLLATREASGQEGLNEPIKVQFRSVSSERVIRSSPIEHH